MELLKCNNMNEEMEENIKKNIEDSFENEHKTSYVRKQLNQLYSDKKWNVFYIRKDKYGYSCGGTTFFCRYEDYLIIIYPSKNIQDESDDDSKEEDNSEKLKQEIATLSEQKSDIKAKLKEAQKTIKKCKSDIDELKLKLEAKTTEINNLQKIITEKEKKIDYLETKAQEDDESDPFRLSRYPREQMMALNFECMDQRLHHAEPCINKDLFVDVEKKIYDKYPEYKEYNNTFLFNGKPILRFKTVEENKLESGKRIIMVINKNGQNK